VRERAAAAADYYAALAHFDAAPPAAVVAADARLPAVGAGHQMVVTVRNEWAAN
jgi:hypothetical protein